MAHKAGLFDLRLVIAMLFAIFGVVLVVVGLAFTDESDLAKADGLNINLWSGVGMVALAAAFTAWATLRPVVVPESVPDAGSPDVPGGLEGSDGGQRRA